MEGGWAAHIEIITNRTLSHPISLQQSTVGSLDEQRGLKPNPRANEVLVHSLKFNRKF